MLGPASGEGDRALGSGSRPRPGHRAGQLSRGRGTILFRTGSGRKLPGTYGQIVAFEVDGWDELAGEVWSVVVRGRARRAREPWELLHAQRLSLVPWHPGDKPWFVVIEPSRITGRTFTPVRPAAEGV